MPYRPTTPTTPTHCECGARGFTLVPTASGIICRCDEHDTRHGLQWSADEDRRLRTLIAHGATHADCAEILKRSPRSVATRSHILNGRKT